MYSSVRFQSARPRCVCALISRFSSTVRLLKTWRPSGTCARPRCARAAGGTASKSWPAKMIRPDTGRTVPAIVLNSVVLPAPLGPTMAINWPSPTVIETSRRACKPPYATCKFSMLSTHPPLSQICLDDLRFPGHLLGRALRQHAAMIEHNKAIDQTHHGAHGVFDHDDGEPCGGKATNNRQHVPNFLVAQAGQGFIEQQELWA